MRRKQGSKPIKKGGVTTVNPSQSEVPQRKSVWRRLLLYLILFVILSIGVYFIIPTRYSGPKHSDHDKGVDKRGRDNEEKTKSAKQENCNELIDEAKKILDTRPQREWEYALDMLVSCTRLEPTSAIPRWNLAAALIKMNRIEEAMNFMDEALNLDPNNLNYLKTTGKLLSRYGYYKGAMQCLEWYLEVSLHIPSWEQLLASISVQREDEWAFLYDVGDDVIHILQLLQISYLHETSLIKAGYLYKVILGLKGDDAEMELISAYAFFAFGLGDLNTGIKYLRMYTEKQYVLQGYGDIYQAYEVVTAHSLRLFTSGFDAHIVSIAKNLLMAGEIVWDELVYNCDLSKGEDKFDFTLSVTQADLRKMLTKCALVQKTFNALLSDGAEGNIHAENIFGWTPLLHAVIFDSPDIVNLLLQSGASVEARTIHALTSLHLVATRGAYKVVPSLIENGLSPTEKDYFNRTSLTVACLHRWTADGMAKALKIKLPVDCPSPVLYSPPPKLSPQGGWMSSGVSLPTELMKEQCDFDVLNDGDIPTFILDYLSLQRPVLIRNATNSHVMKKLYIAWQRNKFEQEYGNLVFNEVEIPYAEAFGYLSTVQTSLKSFMDKMRKFHSDSNQASSVEDVPSPTYIFESIPLNSPLLKHFHLPDILNPNITDIEVSKIQFYLGPPLSGSPMHFHRSAWNVLIYGLKRWFLQPPDQAMYSKQHVWQWWKKSYRKKPPNVLECVQYPGDLVFVPDMWGHAVVNLRESIGVASEFVYGASEFSI